MLFLRQLKLLNYCAYEESVFDFTRPDGTPYPYVCFYGPNGIGKSTLLEAISLLTANNTGRLQKHVFASLQKFVRNPDYNPSYDTLRGQQYDGDGMISSQNDRNLPEMVIEGTYSMDGKDYIVQLSQNGYLRNDFAPLAPEDIDPEDAAEYTNSGPWGHNHLTHRQRIAHFVTSDSDLSLNKFQLHYSQMEMFEEIISAIMRYPADCVVPSGITPQDRGYCTDFIITKNDHRIHFKRMSAGEKKICKSFSELLNLMHDLSNPEQGEPMMDGWPRILLLDNVVMHVYYDRHVTMVECLKKQFHKQQIFSTTHSGILIERYLKGENDQENELYIDLEEENG